MSVGDFLSALRQRAPGDTIELGILRDGEEQTVTATLRNRPGGERPARPSGIDGRRDAE